MSHRSGFGTVVSHVPLGISSPVCGCGCGTHVYKRLRCTITASWPRLTNCKDPRMARMMPAIADVYGGHLDPKSPDNVRGTADYFESCLGLLSICT